LVRRDFSKEEDASFAVMRSFARSEDEFIGDADAGAERNMQATFLARLADRRFLRRFRNLLPASRQKQSARC
jgi:hypothetical protein